MDFFKKIKNLILGFFVFGKTKVQEVEAKIEEGIEDVESAIKQENNSVFGEKGT